MTSAIQTTVSLTGKKGRVTLLADSNETTPRVFTGAQMLLHLSGSAAQCGVSHLHYYLVVQTCFPNSTGTRTLLSSRLPTFAPHLNSWVSQYGALIFRWVLAENDMSI